MADLSGDVVVLGGGVIGLAVAYELARRGAQVVVLERAVPGHGASWAAAGMLAPFTEDLPAGPLRNLALASLYAYPAFAEEMNTYSGVDIHLRRNGMLDVAFDEVYLQQLKRRVAGLVREGYRASMRSVTELATDEGGLSRHALGAALCEEEGQVDNRRLGRALIAACQHFGVRIRSGCAVKAIEANARRVLGVRTSQGFIAAHVVVNTLGSWAAQLEGVPADCLMPLMPVKGQMIALAMPMHFVERVVWAAGIYLVPRADGRLIVGATVEHVGFDQRITAGGVQMLLQGAITALPGAAAFALSETWSGLRPGTPDGLPYLGETPLEGYVVAGGHYRNGILLTPVTSRLIADVIERKAPSANVDIEAFSIRRRQPESLTLQPN